MLASPLYVLSIELILKLIVVVNQNCQILHIRFGIYLWTRDRKCYSTWRPKREWAAVRLWIHSSFLSQLEIRLGNVAV